jgi:colanic acid/amylovoran biosynthesis glycosyltransferase
LNEHDIPFNIPVEVITPALRKELNQAMPRPPLPRNLGTEQNPLVIMSLGRLHWVKDYPLGLRIIAELKKKGVYVQFHILGDGPEREQLMFLRHEMGLQTEVYLKGRASATDIETYFSKAHLYLQTSLAEGFSNACLEAQAFGLPCVVPSISGMRACVLHGKTGMVVDDRKEESFVYAIKHIVENPSQFDPVEISNRIKTGFTLSIQQSAWLNFFNSLILNY